MGKANTFYSNANISYSSQSVGSGTCTNKEPFDRSYRY
jgi:hypothetical protein